MRSARQALATISLLVALTAPVPAATKAQLKQVAPADEYFGRLKLSFLGINNTFRDAGISAGNHTTSPSIASKVDFAMDALNDWQRKFPRDPQLARSYFLAQMTLKKIWIESYQNKAWSYMQHIIATYPATFYGRTIKTEIARGFTRHFFAAAQPCDAGATPAPSVATNNGKYKTVIETPPCSTPSPPPTPAAPPAGTPSPSIVPTASPSPAPASPAPAVAPATPVSEPSATPTASASPAAPAPSR